MDDAVALYLVVHGARAVADAEDEGAARFLALDIGDRFALIAKDVLDDAAEARGALAEYVFGGGEDVLAGYGLARCGRDGRCCGDGVGRSRIHALIRSEEHTSELQSLMRISYAVFCLKKKKTTTNNRITSITYNEQST